MSYILDALRKSESERQQGRIPDFNQQVQMIHKPKRKSVPALVWLALALVINAAVIAIVMVGGFWPSTDSSVADAPQQGAATPAEPTVKQPAAAQAEPAAEPEAEAEPEPETLVEQSLAAPADGFANERPTVIVPSARQQLSAEVAALHQGVGERVPHLVELPLSFQRSVPDLIFNSHVYASDPQARRVMINDHYLRVGDVFSGIRVDRITEDGVDLSKNGKRFRVGVVRDWITPR